MEWRKFPPLYKTTAHFIDKSVRRFSTSTRSIKKEYDKHYTNKCLDFAEDNYFDKLYQDEQL